MFNTIKKIFIAAVNILFSGLIFTSCLPPVMIDKDGHRIFNPDYLFVLESKRRDKWQKPAEVIKAMELSQGDFIADIGAGGGYFTEKFSLTVGRSGRVFATDVQEIMTSKLKDRVKKKKLDNVKIILSRFDDPFLPDNSCDIIFFSSVYKEIDGRISYMKKVKKSLKPGGRVVILEFRREAKGTGPLVDSRLHKQQILDELEAAGFYLHKSYDFLPREYFFIFKVKQM